MHTCKIGELQIFLFLHVYQVLVFHLENCIQLLCLYCFFMGVDMYTPDCALLAFFLVIGMMFFMILPGLEYQIFRRFLNTCLYIFGYLYEIEHVDGIIERHKFQS